MAADADGVRLLASKLAAVETAISEAATATTRNAGGAGTKCSGATATASSSASEHTHAGGGPEADMEGGGASMEWVLRALAALCLTRDEGRQQLAEAKVVKHVVGALRSPQAGARAAGALCVMGLSRSVRNLR